MKSSAGTGEAKVGGHHRNLPFETVNSFRLASQRTYFVAVFLHQSRDLHLPLAATGVGYLHSQRTSRNLGASSSTRYSGEAISRPERLAFLATRGEASRALIWRAFSAGAMRLVGLRAGQTLLSLRSRLTVQAGFVHVSSLLATDRPNVSFRNRPGS